jgi:WD40 repeat protein
MGQGEGSLPQGAEAPAGQRDLFLSYSRADTPAVVAIREILEARGVSTFFDREQLLAGLPWPQALEAGLRGARGVAVFIGPEGLGLWQKREMAFALDRQVAEERNQRGFPVVPVLLPGADVTPGFLFLNTWIDLRADLADPEGLDALAKAARGQAQDGQQEAASGLCPYQGLRPFNEESAAFFCGREAFARRILDTLSQRGLAVVIGPSGSGKSSVVKAGVLPLLRRQRPPDATWDAVCFIPGDRPFQHLAAALMPLLEPELAETEALARTTQLAQLLASGEAPLADVVDRILAKSQGTDRLLVVADQFEELFTQCPDEERRRFLDMLLRGNDRSRLTGIITLRGTFYEHLIAADRRISDRLENAIVNLGPMTREELYRAIVEPAKRLGLSFEPGLAKRMLDEVGDEPGNLPLLQFALTELWARREGRMLTHAAYEQTGGVSGAIVQRTESVFAGLSSPQQEVAKRALLRLVWVGAAEDNAEASRRVALEEMDGEAQRVLQVMADARLLVIGQGGEDGELTVEVAHEALIRKWSRLREWLDEDREFLLWRRRLQVSREIWKHNGKDEASLLHGTPLREAERWLTLREALLAGEDGAFIRDSLAVDERERAARRRRRRRFLGAASGLAVVFMLLAGLAGWQSLTALSQELAATARSRLQIDPEQSLMLGIEAVKAQHTHEAYDVLKLALQSSLVVALSDKLDFLTQVGFSPDGKILATVGKDHKPRLWDFDGQRLSNPRSPKKLPDPINILATDRRWTRVLTNNADHSASVLETVSGRVLGKLEGHQGLLTGAAFSPDGTAVVTASEDGTARLWDMRSFQLLRVLRGHADRLTDAVFSHDGKRVATASVDETAILWDARDGQKLAQLKGHQSTVNSVRFSADDQRVVTASGDNTALVWDARSGKRLARLEGHVDSVTFADFSPADPGLILTISRDRVGKVWKSLSASHWDWHPVNELRGHADILTAATFSPDGKFIVTVSRDRSVRVWKSLTEHGRLAFYGHKDSLSSLAFNADGGLLITGSDDRTAKIWDARSGKLLRTLAGHEDNINRVAFDAEGARAVTASDDNTARLWEVATGKTLHVLDGLPDKAALAAPAVRPEEAAFSPDGTLVATLEDAHAIRVRAVGKESVLAELEAPDATLTAVAFSPRGDRLAAADRAGWVRLWDAKAWQSVAAFQAHEGPVAGLAFRGDGALLATAGEDRALRLWEASGGKPWGKPMLHDAPLAKVEFSADGKTLMGTTDRHEIGSWNIESGVLIGIVCADCAPLGGHTKRVTAAEFSPDGRQILTASRDGTARVWDAASGRAVAVLDHHGPLVGARFSPDGRRILTVSRDHTAKLWRREGESFEPQSVLEGHGDELTYGEFSPDGRLVATASRDTTARIWDSATGRPIYVLRFHRDWVNSAQFSPDGRLLSTAGVDSNAAVWDLQDGSLKLELRGHGHAVRRARFNEDGTRVVTSSRDGTARVWDLKAIEDNRVCPECSGSIEEVCKQANTRLQRPFTRDEAEKYHLPRLLRLLNFRCAG